MDKYKLECINFINENYIFENNANKTKLCYFAEDNIFADFTLTLAKKIYNKLSFFSNKFSKEKEIIDIEKSFGDFTKIKGFDLVALRQAYNNCMMQSTFIQLKDKQLKETFFNLVNAINILDQNSFQFKQSYLRKNNINDNIIQNIYKSTVIAIGCMSGYLTTNVMQFSGNMLTDINLEAGHNNPCFPNNYDRGLKELSRLSSNGELRKILNNLSTTKLNPENNQQQFVQVAGAVILFSFGIITFIRFLRYIIYQFFYQKEKFAKYLEANAEFIELNADLLDKQTSDNEEENNKDKEIAQRQHNSAQKLRNLANRIRADQREANKKANKEIENDKTSTNDPTSSDSNGENNSSTSDNGSSNDEILF